MVKIHSAQINKFVRESMKDFENRMVVHLKEFFSEECEEMGEEGIQDEIRYGIRRAEVHGFESEVDICRYIDLMFALGSDFDADPDLLEIQEALYDDTIEDPTERMDYLYEVAMQFLEHSKNKGLMHG